MFAVLLTVHILVCLMLILVILLQAGRGKDMGIMFGGGSQTPFGSGGASTVLSKATTVAAVLFMITSLGLSAVYKETPSIIKEEMLPPVSTQPVLPPPQTGQPGAPAPEATPSQQPPAAPSQRGPVGQVGATGPIGANIPAPPPAPPSQPLPPAANH